MNEGRPKRSPRDKERISACGWAAVAGVGWIILSAVCAVCKLVDDFRSSGLGA